jgi:hypothetical protein
VIRMEVIQSEFEFSSELPYLALLWIPNWRWKSIGIDGGIKFGLRSRDSPEVLTSETSENCVLNDFQELLFINNDFWHRFRVQCFRLSASKCQVFLASTRMSSIIRVNP